MKKLFISCPMKGRTDENIKASMKAMHKMAEIIFGEELEVIDSFFEGDVPQTNNQAVYYLGRSIQKLSEADYFIGVQYCDMWKGCDVEAGVARSYGIKSAFVELRECAFLADAFEIERKRWDEPGKCIAK